MHSETKQGNMTLTCIKGGHLQISKHPRINALAKYYALRIKALKEVQEAEIKKLYIEFREKYQCLKQEITEAQGGETSADSLDNCDAEPPTNRNSCYRVHPHYESN